VGKKLGELVFFDFAGVLHYEFLLPDETVNKEYYLNVMRHLLETIRLKWPELWATKTRGFYLFILFIYEVNN